MKLRIRTDSRILPARLASVAAFVLIMGTFLLIPGQNDSILQQQKLDRIRQELSSFEKMTVGDTSRSDASAIVKKQADSLVWVVVKIIVYSVLFLAVIIGAMWLLKKSGLTNSSKIGGGGAMDVLEVLSTGQNRHIVLVRVQDAVYIVGQTPTNITMLDKIEGTRAVELIATTKGGVSITKFKDVLTSFVNRNKK